MEHVQLESSPAAVTRKERARRVANHSLGEPGEFLSDQGGAFIPARRVCNAGRWSVD